MVSRANTPGSIVQQAAPVPCGHEPVRTPSATHIGRQEGPVRGLQVGPSAAA